MKKNRFIITSLKDPKKENSIRKCIIDTKTTFKPEIKQFKGFELAIANEKNGYANAVLSLEDENEELLEFILNDIESFNYQSLIDYANQKQNFFSKKYETKKEIGDFGELFYIYKSNDHSSLENASSMSTRNQTIDVNNKNKIEIKTTTNNNDFFELKYPQWKKANTYVFVSLDENHDGITILNLISKIEEKYIGKNIEFLNQLKNRYKNKKDLQKFLIKTSNYRKIEKNKIKLPQDFDTAIKECKVKININNIK